MGTISVLMAGTAQSKRGVDWLFRSMNTPRFGIVIF